MLVSTLHKGHFTVLKIIEDFSDKRIFDGSFLETKGCFPEVYVLLWERNAFAVAKHQNCVRPVLYEIQHVLDLLQVSLFFSRNSPENVKKSLENAKYHLDYWD